MVISCSIKDCVIWVEWVRSYVCAGIRLNCKGIQVVVDQRENLRRLLLVSHELGERDGIERLTACFLNAIVNQHCVALIPLGLLGVRRSDEGVVP